MPPLKVMKKYKTVIVLIIFLTSLGISREYTLEEKLSQMFIMGFKGTTVKEFNKFTGDNYWGGYIFYSKNDAGETINIKSTNQIKTLLKNITAPPENPRIKPFLAIDMEGGEKQIHRKNDNGLFPDFSAEKKIAKADKNNQEKWSAGIAKYISGLGFNLNLAPVVDVDRKPYKNSRSFSDNPEVIINLSELFITEHHKYNMICTLKHFPGRTSGRRKDINNNYNKDIDLLPFRKLISHHNVDLIMVSTLIIPAIDPKHPSFQSKKTIDLLKSFGYHNIIMTDDLQELIDKSKNDTQLENEIIKTIKSGNDILLFANTDEGYNSELSHRLRRIIKNIIKNKLISEERIEKSFRKILDLKNKYNIEPKEIYLNYTI